MSAQRGEVQSGLGAASKVWSRGRSGCVEVKIAVLLVRIVQPAEGWPHERSVLQLVQGPHAARGKGRSRRRQFTMHGQAQR